jgi:hypothetical protein
MTHHRWISAIFGYCLPGNRQEKTIALSCGKMPNKSKIEEVAFFSGRVLVTFADGMMALFEPSQIRQFAEQTEALKPIPKGPLDLD